MKTNYENLTAFEACVVLAAVLGLALIGFEIYSSLAPQNQVLISKSLEILDMRGGIDEAAGTVKLVMNTTENFYEQFNLAFVQVFSFPDEIGSPLLQFAQGFENYTASVAMEYQNNLPHQAKAGEVLGAMLLREPVSNQSYVASRRAASPDFGKQYYYHAPGMVEKLFKK